VGIKVFCDVTDLQFAIKVESLGADALIAVNNENQWTCCTLAAERINKRIKFKTSLPVISAAGGVELQIIMTLKDT
jgi:nitronate monooxygenase